MFDPIQIVSRLVSHAFASPVLSTSYATGIIASPVKQQLSRCSVEQEVNVRQVHFCSGVKAPADGVLRFRMQVQLNWTSARSTVVSLTACLCYYSDSAG